MRKQWILMMLAWATLNASGQDRNLIRNPGFEGKHSATWAEGWGCWTPEAKFQIVSHDVKSGKNALRFSCNGAQKGKAIWVSNHIRVTPGQTYRITCHLKGDFDEFDLRVFAWDTKGRGLGQEILLYQNPGDTLEQWTVVTKTFVPLPGSHEIAIGGCLSEGSMMVDDVSLVKTKVKDTPQNKLFNASFAFSLREDNMPDGWNAGGEYSCNPFQPDFAEGKFFRRAHEEPSPVPTAGVLYYNHVKRYVHPPIQLDGNHWYTFSCYFKARSPKATVTLDLDKMTPRRKSFHVGTSWRRIAFTAFLKDSTTRLYPRIDFYGHEIFLAAPMLHQGKHTREWEPNPDDNLLPNLWKGQRRNRKTTIPTVTCPKATSWNHAETIRRFKGLDDETIPDGKFKAEFYADDQQVHVAIEAQTGRKTAVRPQGNPQCPGNEMAEVFLSPRANGSPYWHFMGGRNGDIFSEKGHSGKQIAGWNFTARETERGWRGEFAIPFSIFDVPGQETWRISFCTTEIDRGKPLYYSTTGKGGYHTPGGFVKVRGLPNHGREPDATIRFAVEKDLYMTEKDATVLVENERFPLTLTLRDDKGNAMARHTLTKSPDTIPIGTLPEGYYDAEITRQGKTYRSHFRKLPYRKNVARVNRFKRQILLDEKPFFPIVFAWCGMGLPSPVPTPWHVEQLRKRHINTICIEPELFYEYRQGKPAAMLKKVILAFANNGFKLIAWTGLPQRLQNLQEAVDYKRNIINDLQPWEDAIIAWYFLDEPSPAWSDKYKVGEKDFALGYRQLKKHAPYDLHFINWMGSGLSHGMKFYGAEGATDIYCADRYPFTEIITFRALAVFEHAARIIHERCQQDFMPAIVWLQTYSHAEGLREPHQREFRNNVYVALIHRLVGLINFNGRPESTDLWNSMAQTYGTAVIWWTMTAHQNSKMLQKGKQDNMTYALWKNGRGGIALMVANTGYAEETAILNSPVSPTGPPQNIGGEGAIQIQGKTIKVTLPIAGSAAWMIP